MKIKQSILSGIIFSGTSLFCYLGFAAYTNLPNQNSGDVMTSTIWNNLIDKVNNIGNTYAPTGMVSAFYGTSCPSGWVLADGTGDEPKTDGTLGTLDLRGEFIRGLDNGRGVDSGRVIGTWQTDDFKSHSHGLSSIRTNASAGVSLGAAFPGGGWGSTAPTGGTETRPRNVALLYCIKQ